MEQNNINNVYYNGFHGIQGVQGNHEAQGANQEAQAAQGQVQLNNFDDPQLPAVVPFDIQMRMYAQFLLPPMQNHDAHPLAPQYAHGYPMDAPNPQGQDHQDRDQGHPDHQGQLAAPPLDPLIIGLQNVDLQTPPRRDHSASTDAENHTPPNIIPKVEVQDDQYRDQQIKLHQEETKRVQDLSNKHLNEKIKAERVALKLQEEKQELELKNQKLQEQLAAAQLDVLKAQVMQFQAQQYAAQQYAAQQHAAQQRAAQQLSVPHVPAQQLMMPHVPARQPVVPHVPIRQVFAPQPAAPNAPVPPVAAAQLAAPRRNAVMNARNRAFNTNAYKCGLDLSAYLLQEADPVDAVKTVKKLPAKTTFVVEFSGRELREFNMEEGAKWRKHHTNAQNSQKAQVKAGLIALENEQTRRVAPY